MPLASGDEHVSETDEPETLPSRLPYANEPANDPDASDDDTSRFPVPESAPENVPQKRVTLSSVASTAEKVPLGPVVLRATPPLPSFPSSCRPPLDSNTRAVELTVPRTICDAPAMPVVTVLAVPPVPPPSAPEQEESEL